MSESKEVRDWKKDAASAAEKTAQAERPTDSFISLQSGIMSYQDNPLPGNEVEVVVQAGAGLSVSVTKEYKSNSTVIVPGQTAYVITINDNGGTATSQQIADALNADAEALRIIQVQFGGDGTGVVAAFSTA